LDDILGFLVLVVDFALFASFMTSLVVLYLHLSDWAKHKIIFKAGSGDPHQFAISEYRCKHLEADVCFPDFRCSLTHKR